MIRQITEFSNKILVEIKRTDTPVLDFWWCLPWVSKPGWILCVLLHLCDPQIHLWCDTCWLYRGQHGSWAFSIHILTNVSASIGGGLGQGSNPWPSIPHTASTALHTTRPLCARLLGLFELVSSYAAYQRGTTESRRRRTEKIVNWKHNSDLSLKTILTHYLQTRQTWKCFNQVEHPNI